MIYGIRYVAIYSTELIKQQRSSTALELFIKYGAPAKPQNLNIYRHLATEILMEDKHDMKLWIGLRDIFHQLVKAYSFSTNNTIPYKISLCLGEGSDFSVHQHGIRALFEIVPLLGD